MDKHPQDLDGLDITMSTHNTGENSSRLNGLNAINQDGTRKLSYLG
jgi:hypothetical protein